MFTDIEISFTVWELWKKNYARHLERTCVYTVFHGYGKLLFCMNKMVHKFQRLKIWKLSFCIAIYTNRRNHDSGNVYLFSILILMIYKTNRLNCNSYSNSTYIHWSVSTMHWHFLCVTGSLGRECELLSLILIISRIWFVIWEPGYAKVFTNILKESRPFDLPWNWAQH